MQIPILGGRGSGANRGVGERGMGSVGYVEGWGWKSGVAGFVHGPDDLEALLVEGLFWEVAPDGGGPGGGNEAHQ